MTWLGWHPASRRNAVDTADWAERQQGVSQPARSVCLHERVRLVGDVWMKAKVCVCAGEGGGWHWLAWG